MSKKRKCCECTLGLRWAIPQRVTSDNIEYAKHCLKMVEQTCMCDHSGKTKSLNNEQYCKYYIEKPKDK